MPVNEEPTVESLSKDISELQRVVKELQLKVASLSRTTDLPSVPQIPSPGSIGEKNLAIGQRVVNLHSNEDIQRITYERAVNP
jgi:hypothetical protein